MMKFPDTLTLFGELIALPSISSVEPEFDQGNREVIERLANWLDGAGFRTDVLPIPGRPDKANLIARLGDGEGGLVLAGHTDTVPFDEQRWNHDPFRATESDGRLYGLGTSDMKGFFALALEAVRDLDPASLREPITILATADEESSMSGARELVRLGRPRARYAVIGEPTGLRPVRCHKGIMMEGIRLTGRSGHSSDPTLGNSALEGMHHVMGELLKWREELQQRFRDTRFQVPVPTLNLGHIHGGDNPNRICAACGLDIDLRPVPGMSLDELRGELDRRLRPVAEQRGLQFSIETLFPGVPAFETDEDSPIVRASEELTQQSSGSVNFATEGPYLAQLGIETVVLGPGDIEQAHQPDEYLALERITPTVTLLQKLIRRFCC
ncbi:MAG: acetylornithine deacetylase [Gammaproteobacteria bacterium]